jgi:opacity protein-like surface antigen
LAALILVAAADTQTAQARWALEIEAGAMVPFNDIRIEKGGESATTDFDAAGSIAIGGAYGLGDYFELTGTFRSNFAGVIDNFYSVSLTGGGRVDLLPPHRVRPWIGTEIGWYHARADFNDLFGSNDIEESDDSFGLNAGGGLDVAVSRVVSLGVDVRYHNAFTAFDRLELLTAMLKVGVHFGADRENRFRREL